MLFCYMHEGCVYMQISHKFQRNVSLPDTYILSIISFTSVFTVIPELMLYYYIL